MSQSIRIAQVSSNLTTVGSGVGGQIYVRIHPAGEEMKKLRNQHNGLAEIITCGVRLKNWIQANR